MELFIHYSAIDMTCDAASVMAATLASGGLCPLTGEKVVYPEAVRNCLSMMNCCGVNDYSGEFMFEVRFFSELGLVLFRFTKWISAPFYDSTIL